MAGKKSKRPARPTSPSNNSRSLARPNQPPKKTNSLAKPPNRSINHPGHVSNQSLSQPNGLSIEAHYEGPLPPPNLLRQFDEMIPNGADRYMQLVEKQAGHRQDLEKSVVKSGIISRYIGQASGLIIGVGGISAGTYLVATGHDASGSVFFGTTLLSLVGIFITGKWKESKERKEKAKEEENNDEE